MGKRKRSEITAICRTKEEEFVMTVLIVYCQAAYRELKKEKAVCSLRRIVLRAKQTYNARKKRAEEPKIGNRIWW